MNDWVRKLRAGASFVAGAIVGYCECGSSAFTRCVGCNNPVCTSHAYLSPNERRAICSWCVEEISGMPLDTSLDEDVDAGEEPVEAEIIDVDFVETD